MDQRTNKVTEAVSLIAERYGISSIKPLLSSCRAVAEQDEITIAVVGRFKAGKSSFLNHLLGRSLVPVGVIPVTAVITEIGYGPEEKATVHYLDGRTDEIRVDEIRYFIAENENPNNARQVSRVVVELPSLARFKGLRFVDTPGLESVLLHNTEASLDWLPNIGLALVAVSIDTPLSRHDLELLKNLHQYTPGISILLTKADLLSDAERAEVIAYVRQQLKHTFDPIPQVFLYSVRPAFEEFKTQVEENLIAKTLSEFQEHRRAILERKLETLLCECEDYLTLALTSAEMVGSERDALRRQAIGEKEIIDDVKSEMRLIVRHAAGVTRSDVSRRLEAHRKEVEARLREGLEAEFPKWAKSLSRLLQSFERWLSQSLSEELLAISMDERAALLAPLEKLKRQVRRRLQGFRDELSDRAVRAFGVPLRTTETEISIQEPRSPDIRIGRVFDRNWELLSPILPMWLVKPVVKRHFAGKVPDMVEKNLSRLTTQWADSIAAAMTDIGKEAERRVEELIETVGRLLASSSDDAPQIRKDIDRINSIRREMCEAAS